MSVLFYPFFVTGEPLTDPSLNRPLICHQNLFLDGSVSQSSETDDGFAANALTGTTFDYWVPAEMPAWLEVTLNSAQLADYCAIAAHTCGSKMATVIVEYWAGGDWVQAASVIPADDEPMILVFPQATSDRWRVRLVGPNVAVIGALMLGHSLVVPGGIEGNYVPPHMAGRVDLLSNVSLKGNFLGSSVSRRGAEEKISFTALPTQWVRLSMEAFRQHFNIGAPFFFAWAPVTYPGEVMYCRRRAAERTELRPELRGQFGGVMWVTMDVEAHVGS